MRPTSEEWKVLEDNQAKIRDLRQTYELNNESIAAFFNVSVSMVSRFMKTLGLERASKRVSKAKKVSYIDKHKDKLYCRRWV